MEKLNDPTEAEKIINNLYTLRNTITKAENVAVHVAANWEQMQKLNVNLNEPWMKLIKENDTQCKQQ